MKHSFLVDNRQMLSVTFIIFNNKYVYNQENTVRGLYKLTGFITEVIVKIANA